MIFICGKTDVYMSMVENYIAPKLDSLSGAEKATAWYNGGRTELHWVVVVGFV